MNKDVILKLLLEDPDLAASAIHEIINKYKPVAYKLLHELVDVYKDYANNTEFPAICAKVKKNTYDAYVNVGFTEDQALALMINDNIQLMKNINKTSHSTNKISDKLN